MKKVLLFTDWYIPGYKAGGPIQSCHNLVVSLKEHYSFYVYTSNCDLGDNIPYKNITPDKWVKIPTGEAVYYASSNQKQLPLLKEMLQSVKPDIVYFNSMFSYKYTILPLIVLKTVRFKGKVILAPRGMLHQGALSLKSRKKQVFLRLFKLLNFQKKICFHATDQQEVRDINAVFNKNSVVLAKNIPNQYIPPRGEVQKQPGEIKLVFISRVHPTKNISYIIDVLNNFNIQGQVILDVFGAESSVEYLNGCREKAANLPRNITVNFLGGLPHHEVVSKLQQYHVLVLPTLGENFGHIIFEALMSGLPVLISDRTPWRHVAGSKAGWDIALDKPEEYAKAIQELINMNQQTYIDWVVGARNKAEAYLKDADFSTSYSNLFS